VNFVRRQFLYITGIIAASPVISLIAWAQTGPKASQILRKDLEGQGGVVQETVVTIVEFPPGTGAPWHFHPGAQEVLYALEGNLTLEIDGERPQLVRSGGVGVVAADVPHTARNESTGVSVKALVVHSRSDKDKPLRIDGKRG
jgi:quercetin dioxygenase-like cupin family protein